MEINNENGKFTIELDGNKLIINAWNGETKTYSINKLPASAVGDCIQWMDDVDIKKLRAMIGDEKTRSAIKWAMKWRTIDEDTKNDFLSILSAAALGSIKSDKKTASSRENGKKGGRPKKDRITIYLDAGTDLSVACLPDSRKDIEKFEREYKRAAKQYAKEHDMIIDVETDPTAPLPANYDEERHTEIWQAIHNMIPN